jgi:hypothetical protein
MFEMKRQAAPKAECPVSVQAGVLAAAILCLWGAFGFYDFESTAQAQSQNHDPYMIEAQGKRLATVKQAVPENAILGYLTDIDPASITAIAMFDAAQYTLAPRLIRMGATEEWILGNFTRPADFGRIGASHGLRVYRNFGNGVILYQGGGR